MQPNDDTLTVPVTNFDLRRIGDGHEMTLATLGGTPVVIRLYGVDELLTASAAAQAELPEDGRPDPMTREQAIELCQPLSYLVRRRA